MLQDVLRAHTKIPSFVLMCLHVLCDIWYCGFKRKLFVCKEMLNAKKYSEMRVESTALIIMSHSHTFSHKIKISNQMRRE